MDKNLNNAILEAIQTIVESAEGDVSYSVNQSDYKPFLSKASVTRTVDINIQINLDI